ncbi:DUF2971 domain-containing protein [Pseudomonas sp. Marseille-P9899]|uniref:DUF2971 domain-containing protein n=1 Tax=Pseudomonas sp. Marseille-P9899 TaxID=2730401 RepID=UPI00158BD326|nr:DUF2971 domain-containing protein [Pseudomonas sp. Marseille-P9899]
MDFSKVVKIFESETLYFANPSVWDDPYEKRLKHPNDHAIFAQCWGQMGISDAMWRIYSSNGLGVRISTTPRKLRETIRAAIKESELKYRLRAVEYKSKTDLDQTALQIEKDLKEHYSVGRAVDMLYMKRDAFSHETEWRATLFSPKEDRSVVKSGISIKVDPHYFVNNILLDPRAPEELVDALKFYFKNKFGFKGQVTRSALYRSPRLIKVEDTEITEDML